MTTKEINKTRSKSLFVGTIEKLYSRFEEEIIKDSTSWFKNTLLCENNLVDSIVQLSQQEHAKSRCLENSNLNKLYNLTSYATNHFFALPENQIKLKTAIADLGEYFVNEFILGFWADEDSFSIDKLNELFYSDLPSHYRIIGGTL